MKFVRRLFSAMNSQRRWLLLCCFMIVVASVGSRLYAEFAVRTGSRLYVDWDFEAGSSWLFSAPFIGPFLIFPSASYSQVVIFWTILFGVGVVAWRLCTRWLTYSLVVTVAILVLVGEWFWIRMQPDARGRVVPIGLSIDMEAFPAFAGAMAGSQSMTVYEGVPRNWGRPEPEQTGKATFVSHRHEFYTSAVAISAEDADTLLWLASHPSSFREWRGMKVCFGFQSDWMIRWISSDGATHELQLCFGCGEAIMYSAGDPLYCDLGARNEFKAILGPYAMPLAGRKKP